MGQSDLGQLSVAIPAPLSTARVSGYDFGAPCPPGGWIGTGDCFGWPTHLGSDIGTPAGSPIVASFPGVASFQSGLAGYGNLLTEKFANGWEFLFGHVASGISGPVTAGEKIGVTGANVGSARGAVTLFQIKNPQGVAVNPDPTLQALLQGQSGGSSGSGSDLVNFQGPGGISLQVGNPAAGISDAISAIPTTIGHGLADAIGAGATDVGVFFRRQAVALFVAAVVLFVLFQGDRQ